MTDEFQHVGLLCLLRSKLNRDKIKLWLEPYTGQDGISMGEIPLDLITKYKDEMQLPESQLMDLIENLRLHALERLAARNKYQETGVASLRIKIPCSVMDVGSSTETCVAKNMICVPTDLKITGARLIEMVSETCGMKPGFFRLISGGKFLLPDETLEAQKITPNSMLMAIIAKSVEEPSPSSSSASTPTDPIVEMKKIRRDAEVLAKQAESMDDSYIKIADQSGRPLQMPKDEKRALTLAMILNEKGKALLLKKDYSNALILLLEADEEFMKCRSDILNLVDNYAILCLDITWCYLCLKSIEELPDAEKRLKLCEDCLTRSYGKQFERLAAVKGNTINEMTLMVRLHLLQGILAYFKKQWKEANRLLIQASNELQQLRVDDEKLAEVMALGYSQSEARLGLRNSSGNIELAVNLIMQRRQDKKEILEKEKVEREKQKRAQKLGKTINNELVNVDFYDQMLTMGYKGSAAKEALKQSNNNISLAVQILAENANINYLSATTEYRGESSNNNFSAITDEMIARVASCGFNPDVAKKCLQQVNGDVQVAIEKLVACGGLLLLDGNLNDNSDVPDDNTDDNKISPENLKRKEMEKDAYNRLRDEMPEDEESHLDLTLEDELIILQEYMILLQHVNEK